MRARTLVTTAGFLVVTGCGLSVTGGAASADPDAGVVVVVVVAPEGAAPQVEEKESGASTLDAGLDAPTGCGVACPPWAACEEGTCVDVAKALNGVRHEIPCTNDNRPACGIGAASPPDKTITLTGTAGKTYELVVRLRGVLEQRTYANDTNGPATGTNAVFFTQGGSSSATDPWNLYDIRISAPNWTWHLNSGTSGHTHSDPIGYAATMKASANATLTIHADSVDLAQANNQDMNGTPLVIPSLSPTPFLGQFVQLDLVSVSLAP